MFGKSKEKKFGGANRTILVFAIASKGWGSFRHQRHILQPVSVWFRDHTNGHTGVCRTRVVHMAVSKWEFKVPLFSVAGLGMPEVSE
ncbi:Lon protease, chloroplastic/mitochondrial -like protein [Gossypium arboreum]|uniref:Lon protease, chloroplastic/mitochondrial-like protein n=1 Tax=Gossypium arboreum TaxID=29729 RepID=A0A0B0MM53_GOSAR|nr:Lon protease, chloroplastic/mitochondrial -like protein [Gossypium arboreum]